jgi:hypothetical protein
MRPLYVSDCPHCRAKNVLLELQRTLLCPHCNQEYHPPGYLYDFCEIAFKAVCFLALILLLGWFLVSELWRLL